MVSPNVRAIQKSRSERHPALFLNQFEQAFPYAELRKADEKPVLSAADGGVEKLSGFGALCVIPSLLR
ncbi:hypothetical protein HK16_19050 [Acetobacter senegalensis]|uniref:Uncharacterized protein n=1 Tax=Acetobacter senegalensis TaxID=446692 RepID=A0A252EFX0_9PROT|nr:hypothetical protein HK16_19050 [Acetobacter senegalensis]